MRNMVATAQAVKSKYNDIMRYRAYFGAANPATASVWTTDPVILFNKGQGQVVKNITTNADVTLRKSDTSLFNANGIIPNAQSFTIMAIGIDIHLANVQANVPFEDDTITQIDVNPVQTVNPYPLIDAVRTQGVFTLYRNSTEFLEEGNVADYPCGLSNSGWGSDGSAEVPALGPAASTQAAYNVNGFIIAQNGMSFRPLTVWHQLAALDQFQAEFTMSRPLLLTGTGLVGYIDFLLLGQADVNRNSNQFVQNFG